MTNDVRDDRDRFHELRIISRLMPSTTALPLSSLSSRIYYIFKSMGVWACKVAGKALALTDLIMIISASGLLEVEDVTQFTRSFRSLELLYT